MAMTIYVPPMAENNLSGNSTGKRERQQISIPFIWEERPGIPIKDWKPKPVATSNTFTFKPPVKLIASVPFDWEEKPGTPLPFFSQTSPQENIIGLPSTIRDVQEIGDNDCIDQQHDHEEDEMSESEVEASESETTYESFSSAPSLLANGLIPSVDISCAVHVEETSPTDIHGSQPKSPLSPTSETGSSILSYATGTTSLVGHAFLEKLFPLLSPNSSFLQKGQTQGYPVKGGCHDPTKVTLGELIMMSRRRSYQRKTIQMHKRSISKELMDDSTFGCSIFGITNSIGELHNKWKRQLHLKLI